MSHCVIEDVTNVPDPVEFDEVLSKLLVRCDGSTSELLEGLFGFLKRKTNFFKNEDPKKSVLDALRKVGGDSVSLRSGFLGAKSAAAPPAAKAAPAPTGGDSKPAQASSSLQDQSVSPAAPVQPPTALPEQLEASADKGPEPEPIVLEDEKEDDKLKGLKPTARRGAVYDNYSWGQDLSEVTVNIPVPKGTRARMLDVVIAKSKLKVGLKGQPPLVEGELTEPIKPDDCMWNIVDDTVELTLAKQDGMHWWKAVIKGDAEIDTQKVEPENSKLTDLDAETRQTVEKMMFDQRQKALGLPTSEESQKQEMLKKFMAAHPEMDFSNAKVM